jgi:SAM-dependent methyltransferase
MPSRAQNGGSISDNFDQQSAHRPAPPASGARQDGQSGGSTMSSPARNAARMPSRNCVTREGAASWLAGMNWFMLQLYQMPSNPTIFDRQMLRARQRRAGALGPETFLIDRVAAELAERLSVVMRNFERAVDLGTPTDAVHRALEGNGKITSLIAAARYDAPLRVAADEEVLPFADGSLDLVVSALALQFVNDLPGTLIQVRRALKPDGLLLAALAGGDTLSELREAFAQAESEIEGGISPRVAPFADLRELGALLQRAGFALPVVDSDRLTVRYASVFDLMRDLRRMGATNVLSERRRTPLKRATLQRLAEIYAERFADADGRLRATFEIAWLSGWVPHESQQKPLKPGSAQRRLADALGTKEVPTGEKPGG